MVEAQPSSQEQVRAEVPPALAHLIYRAARSERQSLPYFRAAILGGQSH